MSDTLAEIVITIKEDQIIWNIGKLDIPNAVFWLEDVKSRMLAQVHGDESIVRSTNH